MMLACRTSSSHQRSQLRPRQQRRPVCVKPVSFLQDGPKTTQDATGSITDLAAKKSATKVAVFSSGKGGTLVFLHVC